VNSGTSSNTGKAKPIPAAWIKIITGYLSYLAAGDSPMSTIGTRRSHLAFMARGLDLTPREVTEDVLVDWFGKQHWATETRRSYRTTLNGFYRWAYRRSLLKVDLSYSLPHVKTRRPMPRPTPEDVRIEAYANADRDIDGGDRLSLMLELADHGMRRGEVARCSTDDLIADGPRLIVHGKGDKRRIIPINEHLATRIAAGAAGHTTGAAQTGYLFPGKDAGHLSPRWVGRLCSRAMPGIWTMHSLRHRTATTAFRITKDIVAIKDFLGHESVATTQMYIQRDDDAVRNVMLAATGGRPPGSAGHLSLLPAG